MEGHITKTQWAGIVMVVVCVMLLAVASVHGWHSTRSYTCLQCRAELQQHRWFGVPSSHFLENDCSRWYSQTHPAHEHDWCWSGSRVTKYPLTIEFACGKRHAIWSLPPKVQMEFMRSASSTELEMFWAALKTASREGQQAIVQKAFEKVLDSK